MINGINNSHNSNINAEIDKEIKKDVNSQIQKNLSTIFIIVGIISFTLGAIVNWYTIKRIKLTK